MSGQENSESMVSLSNEVMIDLRNYQPKDDPALPKTFKVYEGKDESNTRDLKELLTPSLNKQVDELLANATDSFMEGKEPTNMTDSYDPAHPKVLQAMGTEGEALTVHDHQEPA